MLMKKVFSSQINTFSIYFFTPKSENVDKLYIYILSLNRFSVNKKWNDFDDIDKTNITDKIEKEHAKDVSTFSKIISLT